ncbi:ABC transporter permease [Pleionea litopenaei]|uniref:ABC transporter permease n=1 Tax=Pleionea litopenaei TaxID=3070815 RepID=A0AA51RWX2_9GAMM|nr:ABC transporter permease [Pleionea sp. HL-JVS1]WMS89085.1 ABC transporter permease [Pleionea sp. HL-JVS1]
MFKYYLKLALLSIKRTPILTLLMVSAIGVGIGASMTTITVNYAMSGNPIPEKSDQLFAIQLDTWDPNDPFREPNLPPDQLTYLDATALMRSAPAEKQTAMTKVYGVIEPEGEDTLPIEATGRAAFGDFFSMFKTPFLFGGAWNRDVDNNEQMVTVLSREMNDKVFGGENSVGKYVTIGGQSYQVVGVLDDFSPVPKYYDVTNGPFNDPEDYYIPFNLVASQQLDRSGNTNCWKPNSEEGWQGFLNSECVWIQFWAELPTKADQENYLSFLNDYAKQQKELGRFPRPLNNKINNVMEWLEQQEVVSENAQVVMWLSVMFLVVCLLNTIGILLTKFSTKAAEIGLRRALGASKSALFIQHLFESAMVGFAGGLLGLALAFGGLQGVHALFGDDFDQLVQLDFVMVTSAIVLAIISALLAGIYPTWRACNIQPAVQLKTQ